MGTVLRLGFVYACIFACNGAALPYLPLLFRQEGYSGAEIGLILAAPMLGRVATGPLIAIWADGFRDRRTGVAVLLATAALSYLAIGIGGGFMLYALAAFLAGSVVPASMPLLDVVTLRRARAEGFDYGWARGMGSAAFIGANIGVGLLLGATSAEVVPLWAAATTAIGAAGAAFLAPPEPVRGPGDHAGVPPSSGMGVLLRDGRFLLLIGSVGLIQAAHGFYYGFSTLVWTAQGISPAVIGLLWSFGVVVEIAFLWFGGPVRRVLGPERLLILGGGAALVRWTAFAFTPPLWMLWPLQALHGLTFAATFMASLQLIEKTTAREHASLAQMMNSSVSSGVLVGLATIASGPLFDAVGARGYLAMAAMGAAGAAGAWALLKSLTPTAPEPAAR